MDQIWFWIIAGIIYMVVRALKKPEQQTKDVGEQRPDREVRYDPGQPPSQKPRPLTFEELLREITEAKQAVKPVPAPPAPVSREVDYDDDLQDEEQDLETVEPDYRKRDKLYSDYEEAKRQAFVRPSLEETLNVRDTDVRFGKFKAFETRKERNLLEEYTKDFQDPEGLKKAVVMSEILRRKF